MKGLRLLLLLAIVACLTLAASRAHWESRVVVGLQTYIIDLKRSPVWAPPEPLAYSQFRENFQDLPSTELPAHVLLKWDWTLLDLLMYVWVVTVLFSAAYIAWRGPRRDLVFHGVLGAAIGMTSGAVMCVGLWILAGGWAPPVPEWFGLAGLVVGLLGALLDWSMGKVS